MTDESQDIEQVGTPHFAPIITEHGMRILFNELVDHNEARITHIALGDSAWTPTATAISLQNERHRVPITGTRRVSDTQQHVTFIEQGEIEYWVREVGLLLDDGSLFAVWSDEVHPLAWKAAGIDLILAFDIVLTGLPTDNIVIEATNELNLAPATQSHHGLVRLTNDDEAQVGTSVDVVMTPSATRQHGDERYTQKEGDYTGLRARATTKADVGLSNVPNYSCTSSVSDPSNSKLATAGAVKQAYEHEVVVAKKLVWGAIQYSPIYAITMIIQCQMAVLWLVGNMTEQPLGTTLCMVQASL